LPGERFTRHRFGRGYNVEDVDAFLALAELGSVRAADIQQKQFSTVVRGYDESEVDEALDELASRRTAEGLGGWTSAPPRPWWSRLLGN
jgi:DivIVA domain-containing protein